MRALWQDIRYGSRTLARSPGFTLAALMFGLMPAVGVVVLACAGPFVRRAAAVNRIDPGYDTGRLLAGRLFSNQDQEGRRPRVVN